MGQIKGGTEDEFMNPSDRVFWMLTEITAIVTGMKAGECVCLEKIKRLGELSQQVDEIVTADPETTVGMPKTTSGNNY